MGQYWQFVNIDKRQSLGFWGKLSVYDNKFGFERARHWQFLSFLKTDWAGDRITCIGDYVDMGDYPIGMLTQDELDEMVELEVTLYRMARTELYDTVNSPREHSRQPFSSPDVLRNLSKREYVRSDVVDLGDVGMSRLCWTSDSQSRAKGAQYDFCRGNWAGDRLDIVSLASVLREVDEGDPWTDVSEASQKLLSEVFASEFIQSLTFEIHSFPMSS